MTNFRTEPPWEASKGVPPEYEILAEFPFVVWGWECDRHQWILRAPDGEIVLGRTSHTGFHEAGSGIDAIRELNDDINTLSGFIQDTQRALEMLPND
jgi:hypothetical protein